MQKVSVHVAAPSQEACVCTCTTYLFYVASVRGLRRARAPPLAWHARGSTASEWTVLFWHSIAMTATTPLWRVLTGRWWGSNTPQLLLAWLGVPISPWVGYPWVGAAVGDIYPDPKKTTKPFDAAFGPHVTCGLLWLLIGSLQAVVTRSFKSK